MTVPEPVVLTDFSEPALAAVPNRDAVFLVSAGDRSAYLGKTALLRRRLLRLLRPPNRPGRFLNLSAIATRVEYWPTASQSESALIFYLLAKRNFPDTYLKLTKLRMPCYLKLVLSNEFPRSQVTTRLAGTASLFYGPFRSRASAELFESRFLDLFQIRRCEEDLAPRPDHPGCIYGEMNKCVRPCQQAVTREEYQAEVKRVGEFLRTAGLSLLNPAMTARDRFSEEMQFEQAARQHKEVEKIQAVLGLRDELARDVERLNGVLVTPSQDPSSVQLRFFLRGVWQPGVLFPVTEGTSSLDHRLRDVANSLAPLPIPAPERQEHIALIARLYYSTWRDGEWLLFDDLSRLPYRKLVRAISRAHKQTSIAQ